MMSNNEVAIYDSKHLVRQSTDIASLCKDIVVATACNIKGKKYVKVEGWQAIATAHGCMASARDVERVEGGIRAVGEVKRMTDGLVLSQAEGFVGDDESTWGGRQEYAKRAMAQTRAISRACRSAFAHVVVMMDAGLETTPAEEVPEGGFVDVKHVAPAQTRTEQPKASPQAVQVAKKAIVDPHVDDEKPPIRDEDEETSKIPTKFGYEMSFWTKLAEDKDNFRLAKVMFVKTDTQSKQGKPYKSPRYSVKLNVDGNEMWASTFDKKAGEASEAFKDQDVYVLTQENPPYGHDLIAVLNMEQFNELSDSMPF